MQSRVGAERAGIGLLVGLAGMGCEWLHVDFDEDLEPFYLGACGFAAARAGLIALQ